MSQSRLMTQRRFAPLFWTQFFGAFNDNFLKNALLILITFKAAVVMGISSTEMVPLAGGIFILPFFLFSATAGQIADKYEKSKIIRVIKTAELAIMALATLGFTEQRYDFLLFVLFLMGLHSTFFGPIKYSILPQHLAKDELVGGNALIEAGTFLSVLLGTIAGGVLVSLPGIGSALVSGGLIICAILGLVACFWIPKAAPVDPGLKVQWNPIPPTWQIFQFTRKNRPVYLAVLGISWFWFIGAAILSLLPLYCKDALRTNESVVTLFLACFSIGIGAGSLLCGKLSRGRLELGLVPLGSIGITLFALDLGWQGVPAISLAAAAPITAWQFVQDMHGLRIALDLTLLSIFSGFFIVPLYTMIQERSELSHRSRIIAGNNILNAVFMVAASGSLILFMRLGWSTPTIFAVLAIMNAFVATYIYILLPEFFLRFVAWITTNLI